MLSTLIGKAGITLALVTVCLVALAIVARNWSCRKPREPRPPRIITAGPYDVVDSPTGASLVVAAGRRGRTRTIILAGVAVPASGAFAQVSADHLRGMAGGSITVQYERHGLLRGEAPGDFLAWFEEHAPGCEICSIPPTPKEPEPQFCEEAQSRLESLLVDEPLEARGPLTGLVFGASGINLNLAQIAGGYAKITAGYDAPKEWREAEAEAKKQKLGVWGGK